MKKIILSLILLSIFVIAGCSIPNTVEQKQEKDYCVEWNGEIDRHALDYQCPILSKENRLLCEYSIFPNNKLMVTLRDKENITKNNGYNVVEEYIFGCSKIVKYQDVNYTKVKQ